MSRPAVLHVLGECSEADTTAPVILSTTATRVVLGRVAAATTPPPTGPAPDAVVLLGEALSSADAPRQARRHGIAVVHAHHLAAVGTAVRIAAANRLPWLVTVDEAALGEAGLVDALAGATAVVVPSLYCMGRLAALGCEESRLRLLRPGVALDQPAASKPTTTRGVIKDEAVPAVRRARLLAMAAGTRVSGGHPALAELLPKGVPPRERVVLAHEIGARAAELDAIYLAAAAGNEIPVAAEPAKLLPRVTVVVPTFNRRDLLVRTVASLREQSYPADRYDVVVADDQTTDSTLDDLATADGQVRIERLPIKGYAAGARNHGIAKASGQIIAFTDDDCRPQPTWLEAMVAGFADGVDLVQGRTVPDPEQPRTRWSRTISTPREYGLYETANLAVRRSALDALGPVPFDPTVPDALRHVLGRSLGSPGIGEDVVLGWRVRRAGGTRFASHAVVRHHIFEGSPKVALRDAIRAAGFPLLVRQVPELRRAFLWHRYFLRAEHPALLVALVATVLAGVWWPYFAVAAAPYLWLVFHPDRPGRVSRARGAPFGVLRDLVELLGCVVGSVHARRLVL
ncbi:MAG TPA: glycosyltransferase [Mycobacteriales bacterium]|nr:glycosyltransferase [Mycobacteriales bacterium]